jgi:hypothetical protein
MNAEHFGVPDLAFRAAPRLSWHEIQLTVRDPESQARIRDNADAPYRKTWPANANHNSYIVTSNWSSSPAS